MATPIHRLTRAVASDDIDATSAVGQTAKLSLYHRNDRVVLIAPPGETAVMHPDDARLLADHLYDHADAVDSLPPGRVFRLRTESQPDRPRTGSGT